jgi:hypothetical protein
MVYSEELSLKNVLESWKPYRESDIFVKVVDSISGFFSFPSVVGFFFRWFEGAVSIITILVREFRWKICVIIGKGRWRARVI